MCADADLPRGRLALPLAVRGGARVAGVAGAPLIAAVMLGDVVGAPALAPELLVCVTANRGWKAVRSVRYTHYGDIGTATVGQYQHLEDFECFHFSVCLSVCS